MRTLAKSTLAAAFVSLAAVETVSARQIVVKMEEVAARRHNHDECLGSTSICFGGQADFNPSVKINAGPLSQPGWLFDYDVRIFDSETSPFIVIETVPVTQRIHTVTVSLPQWDPPEFGGVWPFDINPSGGGTTRDITLTFDACTLTWRGNWPGSANYAADATDAATTGACMPWGDLDGEQGHACLAITTDNGLPFTGTNDVFIAPGHGPVQVATAASFVVENKPTAFRVNLGSTWTVNRNVQVQVTLNDGVHAPVTDSKTLVVPPGGTRVYLFDGTATQPPFLPAKQPNDPTLRYTIQLSVDVPEVPPPGTPPDFLNCWGADNSALDFRVPVVRTREPEVRYIGWDFNFTPVGFEPAASYVAHHGLAETYRKAVLPLAALTPPSLSRIDANLRTPYDAFGPFADEPVSSIFIGNVLAYLSGVDRLVLTPRTGWFTQRATANAIDPSLGGVIGISYGPALPRAVIAEPVAQEVPTHELLHTYGHSRRSCSAGAGRCLDEYLHVPPRTYWAVGYDVEGTIYPAGKNDLAPGNVPPGSREVTANNIMGFCCGNWVDSETFNTLVEDLRAPGDPELVNLSGFLTATNGIDAPVPSFTGRMISLYHASGVPDREQPASGESEAGRFSVRLYTPNNGAHVYHFDPQFGVAETTATSNTSAFSIAVPWDPATTAVELRGPADYHNSESNPGDVTLWFHARSASAPVVQKVRAGRNIAPDLNAQTWVAPTIGPGSELVLGWKSVDPDNEPLKSAVLLLAPPPPNQVLPRIVPSAVEIDGSTMRVPYGDLAPYPGVWGARVFSSDGLDSGSLDELVAFTVCAFTNNGVEACDKIDNDCDGVVDNLAPGPRLTFAADKKEISWTGATCGTASWDLARGDLGPLRATGSFAGTTCLENNGTDMLGSDASVPAAGSGYYYLVRVNGLSWNDGTQVGNRDLTLASCP